jgi:flagella basal body P-ring formation protein FlgA
MKHKLNALGSVMALSYGLMSPGALVASQASTPLCQAAVQAVEEQARQQDLSITVACRRDGVGKPIESAASVSVIKHVPPLRTGPIQVVLRVQSLGARPMQLAQTLDLRVRSQVWQLNKDVVNGDRVRASDVVLQAYEWPAGVAPRVAGTDAPTGRARQALRAGQPIAQNDLLSDQELSRGEAVTVLIQEGRLSLQVPARVTTDARVGTPVRAQLDGRREVVEGVLVDASTVLVGARNQ